MNPTLQHRSAVAVFILTVVTFGIYSLIWFAKTRGEVNGNGARALTTWWLLCPFAIFWYGWSLSKGISHVTGLGTGGNYALLLLLGNLGQAIVQARINGAMAAKAQATVPAAAPIV